jgi:hypothetical protein
VGGRLGDVAGLRGGPAPCPRSATLTRIGFDRASSHTTESCIHRSPVPPWVIPVDERLVRHILDRYLFDDELRELCDELELSVSGAKGELVDRLLATEDFDPAIALEYLDRRELTETADELGLSPEGTRDELLDRVLDRVAGPVKGTGRGRPGPTPASGSSSSPTDRS